MRSIEALAAEKFLHLTTRGRVSGKPRRIEIWFVIRAGRLYLFAENGHRAQWVMNVKRDPRATVELASIRFSVRARILDESLDALLFRDVQALSQAKYGWGDGLPVELTPGYPLETLA